MDAGAAAISDDVMNVDDSTITQVEDEEDLPWFLRAPESVATTLIDKKNEFFTAMDAGGLTRMQRVAWAYYYGTDPDDPSDFATQQTKRVGPEKEFTRVRINDFRSFVKQQIQTALGPAPAYKATTKSTDFAALAGIDAIDRGISHVMGQAMPDKRRRRLLERAVVLGMSFAHVRWDRDGGDDTTETVVVKGKDGKPLQKPMIDPATKQPIVGAMGIPVTEDVTEEVDTKTGMPVIDIGGPGQIFYDAEEEEDLPWVCVVERRSKWDLAAQFPERAEELRGSAEDADDDKMRQRMFGSAIFNKMSSREDVVMLHHFYLARCAAAPDGRYIGFVEGVEPLWDGPLPVQAKGKLPVVTVVPSAYMGAFLGYADAWDLISIQQLIDNVVSDWASNVRAHGRLTLLNPKGSAMNLEAYRMGLRVLDVNGAAGEPKYLVPPKMDHGTDITNYAHRRMESVSGQNAVRRGDPQANIKSGTMAALFNQISVEFMSDLQQSFDAAEREIANMCLELIQSRGKGEFMVEVAGEGVRPYWEAFKAESTKGIRSIWIETVSPMMRSPSGRFEAYNVISQVPPDKVGAVLRGLDKGDWSGMMQDSIASDMRIKREHELMLQGKYVDVNALDPHDQHYREHFALWEQLEAADPTEVDPSLLDPNGQPIDPMRGTSPVDPATGQPKQGPFEQQKRALLQHMMLHRQRWQFVDPGSAMLVQRMLPPPIMGTPTGDMAMVTGGQAAAPPPGQPQQQQGAPLGAAAQPPDMGQPGGGQPVGEQPQQPKPAEPAESPGAEA